MIINSAEELSALVRAERKKRGWSQKELAEQVGVSPLWVSNFERGKSTAHIGLVLRTLKALNVKLRVGNEPQPHPVTTATADLDKLFSDLHRKINVPKLEDPKIPELKVPEIPKLDIPKIPKLDAPEIPELKAPKIPKLDTPKMPQIPDNWSQKSSTKEPHE